MSLFDLLDDNCDHDCDNEDSIQNQEREVEWKSCSFDLKSKEESRYSNQVSHWAVANEKDWVIPGKIVHVEPEEQTWKSINNEEIG